MSQKIQKGISHDFDSYRILFEQSPICIHEIDANGRLLTMNQAGLDLMGVESVDQVCGRAYLDLVAPSEREGIRRLMDDAFNGEASEFEFLAAGDALQRYFSSCFIPCPNREGEITRLIGISSDITARMEAAADLRRLNHTYAVLSRCNSDLARSVDEGDLLNAFCANLVETGGYLFAWVGYAQCDRARGVSVMARAGEMDDDFSLTEVAWSDDDWKHSACGQAIRTGQPVAIRDIEKEPDFAPWREPALRHGARSMITLPLKADDQTFGSFTIFSTEMKDFSEKEVVLLMKLAEDLAFGIKTARARAERKQKVRWLREEVEQEECRRIAAILHDGVGQSVQSINLGLKKFRAFGDTQLQLRYDLLNKIIDEVGDVIIDLRNISQELRPLYLERLELKDAISYHCSEQSARAGLAIYVSGHGETFLLEERVKEQCFLIFREALNNVVRHAKASRIDVTIEALMPESLSLKIDDDGVGFDSGEAFSNPSGLGLSMISERAESVGGHAEIYSTPGEGTTVTITVPLLAPNLTNYRKMETQSNLLL
jgi:PAS domain S-box-containing protein